MNRLHTLSFYFLTLAQAFMIAGTTFGQESKLGGTPEKTFVGNEAKEQSQLGHWTTLQCKGKPDARHECSFVECGGKFYLLGGRESLHIDQFNPETNEWTRMNAISPLIHHFQPVNWNNKIYMLCAMTGNYPIEPPMSHIQIYDPLADKWTQGGEIPKQRRRGSAGAVVYQDKIYVVCGITFGHTSGTNNWFDEYDPTTDTWRTLPDAPHKRDHFHAVVYGDKMYCMGGRNTSYHKPNQFTAFFGAVIPEIDCFDFKTESWTTLETKMPFPTAAGGISVLKDQIIYFGGETAKQGPTHNNTWLFDPDSNAWTEQKPLQLGRHGSQAITFDDKVFVAGGSPVRGGGKTHTIEMFSY